MKFPIDKQFLRRGLRGRVLFIIAAAAILAISSIIQFYVSRKGMKNEASLRAESELKITKARIMDIINQTETSVHNNKWISEWCLDEPDSAGSVCRRIVEENPVVMGSTLAFVPDFDSKHPLFSPYVFKEGEKGLLQFKTLATQEYDYPSQEWFIKPLKQKKGYWSEPYIDKGGGEILMTTYSMPIHGPAGEDAAVLTADISLTWLTDLIGEIDLYPHAFSLMFSRTGKIMVCPVKDFIMNRTIWEMVGEMDDADNATAIVTRMVNGDRGNSTILYHGERFHIYYEPIERTGWDMCIVIPEAEIFSSLRKIFIPFTILQILGLAMLALILRAVAKNQMKYIAITESKEKIENELHIAREIQMSMIPKLFPPFPDRQDIDVAAAIFPAKEVGGDLYDFYIRDEKLFFCIGDVSGKGVPASLVMAVTRSLFRTVSANEENPAMIVSMMNDSMADINENNMFVTLFCGVLDLQTGRMRYCNAGHNAPVILSDSKEFLPAEPNLPLAIMKGMVYRVQERSLNPDDAIFLYTDGLTEAEDISKMQFGEERMMKSLSGRKTAQEHLDTISADVRAFVGEAPQSDDLTMLFIHYLNK